MNCKEFLYLLDEDGPVTKGPAKEHLDSCPGCQKAFRQWEAVRKELREMREDPAPPFLHTRVMSHVRSAGAVAAPRWTFFSWGRTAWAGPLLAAALLILLGGYGLMMVLEPARMTPAQKQAETARQIGEMKKDLPPMQGPSKGAIDREYRDILEKSGPAAADDEKRKKQELADSMKGLPPLSGASKKEAQKEMGSVLAESDKSAQPSDETFARSKAAPSSESYNRPGNYAPEPPPANAATEGQAVQMNQNLAGNTNANSQEYSQSQTTSHFAGKAQAPPPSAPAPAAAIQQPPQNPPAQQEAGKSAANQEEPKPSTPPEKGPEAPVKCQLEPAKGHKIIYITIPEIGAPPAGTKVGVLVEANGDLQVQGNKAARPENPGRLYKALKEAKLPPGEYLLSRVVSK